MEKRYFVGISQHHLPFEMKHFCVKDLQTGELFGAESIEDLARYLQDMQDNTFRRNITFTLPPGINNTANAKFGDLPVKIKFHEMSPKELKLFEIAIK